jgi:DNA-3-methyladenine glycosylase II
VPFKYAPRTAVAELRKGDRKLSKIIDRVGPFRMPLSDEQTLFQSLLRSIVYQQLSGKAAGTIHQRILQLFPGKRATAKTLLTLSDESLRGAGMSRNKVAAARDLAAKSVDKTIPNRRALEKMDDAEVIERLTTVRGIGPWTVEVLLIFHFGRADVLPVTDLGIRKGFTIMHGGEELPEPAALLAYGERWRPYRSVASWYLWRATDL